MEAMEEVKAKVNEVLITEVPNPLTLEGVEYLLGLNTFNELPTMLVKIAPILVECNILADIDYTEEVKAVYVEKGSELIERIFNLFNCYGINLSTATGDLYLASKWYITQLAVNIGKSEEYNV